LNFSGQAATHRRRRSKAHLPKANYQRLLDRDAAGSPRLVDALYPKRRVTQLIPYPNRERALAFQPDE